MIIHIHKPFWQRLETWCIALVVVIALLHFMVPHARGLDRPLAAPVVEVRLPRGAPGLPPRALPFEAAEVVAYFSTVLEMSPEKGEDGATVFENPQAGYAEDRWRIAISTEGPGVVVQFVVGGDYGLSLAREFFECPVFERAESEALYGMLSRAQNVPVEHLPRFTVSLTYQGGVKLEMLVLRFTPPNAG